jgi:hypothetical protein
MGTPWVCDNKCNYDEQILADGQIVIFTVFYYLEEKIFSCSTLNGDDFSPMPEWRDLEGLGACLFPGNRSAMPRRGCPTFES